MARVPDEEIGRLKRGIDLKDLVESYGIKLEQRGKDWFGLCPFHSDTSPSLVVSPDKNLWNCLGACRAGGSPIDWVMRMEKASFRHAIEILKEKFQVEGSRFKVENPEGEKEKRPANWRMFSESREDGKLLREVLEVYTQNLKKSPEALSYLKRRKLDHPDLIDHFQLGYANRTLGPNLPDKQVKAGREIRGKLERLGIMRESGHEHFAGSLVIPIMDENGNILEMYGRKVGEKLRRGTPLHLYLPGPHKGIFNLAAIAASREVILCEALIDALTFWCHGFPNVTSSYGVNGFTAGHLEAFKKYEVEKVYIAYDNDEAGNRAAESLSGELSAAGFQVYRVVFPRGLDANDCALKADNPGNVFAELMDRAERFERLNVEEEAQTNATSNPAPREIQEEAAGEIFSLAASSLFSLSSDPGLPCTASGNDLIFPIGERKWRVRGLDRNTGMETMKVNVQVFGAGEKYHVDTVDLYSSRQRFAYLREAGRELETNEETLKKELGGILLKLEELQEQRLKEKTEPKKREIKLSEVERAEALSFLKSSSLLEKILADFEACGVAGEEINKLVGYLAAVSRKLDNPLAVIIQSSSAAGKTWLMESILAMMPEEERVKYSAMTGQSLFYLGETDLKHKILAIVEEEGAERASYALKLLQSEGELSIASTGKDPQTGKLITHEYRVEGPVMIFVTTTGIDIDEELQNRCILLTVNESREQTRAIHKLQREKRTLAGLEAKLERERIIKLHRNAQRLLRPLKVVNPYAMRLTFLDDRTRTRRDHDKYLNLIDSISLLYQYQRPVKKKNTAGKEIEYIEVTLEDIATANRLANEVLGRSLDELPPQTRRFLELLYGYLKGECKRMKVVQSEYRFGRRQVCEALHWSLTQVRLHLDRLIENEYVLVHRGERGQSFVYELLYNGEGSQGELFLSGLLDVGSLREYDGKVAVFLPGVAELESELAGSKRGQNAPKTGGWRGDAIPPCPTSYQSFEPLAAKSGENAYIGGNGKNRSRSHTHTLEAAKKGNGDGRG